MVTQITQITKITPQKSRPQKKTNIVEIAYTFLLYLFYTHKDEKKGEEKRKEKNTYTLFKSVFKKVKQIYFPLYFQNVIWSAKPNSVTALLSPPPPKLVVRT